MSNVKANTEKPKRDKYTWLGYLHKTFTLYISYMHDYDYDIDRLRSYKGMTEQDCDVI